MILQKSKSVLQLAVIAVCFPFLSSCGGEEPIIFEDETVDADTLNIPDIDDSVLDEIIHGIPSPVEMTDMIKASGAGYSADVINTVEAAENYTTSHKKALNLGVYGADLGYLNMYGKTGTSLEYLKTIKQLSDDLNVGQFFNFEQLKVLAQNENNLDSLLYLTTLNFSKMNRYLREQKRGKYSVLIVTGTFIEGLSIATQVMQNNPNDQIRERIGEQKLTVKQVIEILKVYKSDPMIADLLVDFEALYKEMEAVTITITPGETVMAEVDGVLTFVQNDESNVEMSDETLQKIIENTAQIRNKIID